MGINMARVVITIDDGGEGDPDIDVRMEFSEDASEEDISYKLAMEILQLISDHSEKLDIHNITPEGDPGLLN